MAKWYTSRTKWLGLRLIFTTPIIGSHLGPQELVLVVENVGITMQNTWWVSFTFRYAITKRFPSIEVESVLSSEDTVIATLLAHVFLTHLQDVVGTVLQDIPPKNARLQ